MASFRYVPKHRIKRRAAARRAGVHAAAMFVGGAVLLSGAYGSGPTLLSAAPLTVDPVASTASTLSFEPNFPSIEANFPSIEPPPAPAEKAVPVAPPLRIDPAFVDIEAIGTVSTIERLGTLLDGRLETPNDFMKVGWWSGGVVPGEKGPAVLAGHLDSVQGPAIFARLSQLKPDDLIRIARKDGVVLTFSVTRIDRYPKNRFPATSVYGPTDGPELRLITCGGTFDRSVHSYNDNTVVYARLLETAATTSAER